MIVKSYGITDIGNKRSNNEDIFLIDEKLGLYLVCDGMGGHAAGEIASETASSVFSNYLHQNLIIVRQGTNDQLDKLLEDATQLACAKVYQLGKTRRELSGMGTTFTGLLIRNQRGFIVHVGDSRLYLLRDKHVHRLTEDHTYYAELIKTGKITPEDASKFVAAQALTRAIGIQESVVVDHLQFDVLSEDVFVLCSDGLINYLENDHELMQFAEKTHVTNLSQALVSAALQRGGHDNTTVIVVDVQSEPKKAARDARFRHDITFRTNTLKEVALFQHLNMAERVSLLRIMKIKEYLNNAVIVKKGDIGENLHIVLDGELVVEIDKKQVATLKSGDHFGEMSLLTNKTRSATVRAQGSTRLMSMKKDDFMKIIQQQPNIGTRLLWNLAYVLANRLHNSE